MIQHLLSNLHIEGIYATLTVLYVLFFGSVLFYLFWNKPTKYLNEMAGMPLLEETKHESK